MRKSAFTGLLCLILCLSLGRNYAQVLPSFGNSRTGTSGMQFLKVAPDARSAGMGGAFHAVVNDVSATYWNPAGLSRSDTDRYQFQFGTTDYFAGLNMYYGGVLYRPSPYRAWGLSLINMTSGDMKVTTEFQPMGTGQVYSVSDVSLGLSYAQVLTDNFSFGVTGKYAYEGIATVKTHDVLFDLGLQYIVGWQDVRFSVGMSNFGFNVQPQGKVTILTLYGDKEKNSYENLSVPAIFRICAAKDFKFKNPLHLLTLAMQLNHPTDNNETLAIGGEYSYRKRFFLRTGYELGQDERGWPSAGFGINYQRRFGTIRLDYGFSNKSIIGNIHRLTLAVSLK